MVCIVPTGKLSATKQKCNTDADMYDHTQQMIDTEDNLSSSTRSITRRKQSNPAHLKERYNEAVREPLAISFDASSVTYLYAITAVECLSLSLAERVLQLL